VVPFLLLAMLDKNEKYFTKGYFESALRFLPWVVLIGIALGLANYSLGVWPTLGQSIFQQVSMSMIIGCGIFVIRDFVISRNIGREILEYLLLIFGFILLGMFGSEVESLIKAYVFNNGGYQFLASDTPHLFNVILSVILGCSVYYWTHKVSSGSKTTETNDGTQEVEVAPITSIPIRQGDTTSIHELSSVLYFEAYDNYAFMHTEDGERILTNNSLLELERKLTSDFVRIHRKYLANRNKIYQIQPHLKGRFTITFKDKGKTSIVSSAGFTDVVKAMTKI